jgi:hypothetical protein
MRTAVVLPGRMHGHDAPSTYVAGLALEAAGYAVTRVEWPAAGMPVDLAEAAAAVAEVARPHLEAGPDLVVGKSLGTLAAPLATTIAAVWLTPRLDDPVGWTPIERATARRLVVGGEADPAWDPGVADRLARAGADVLRLPGADHALFVEGDPAATADTLVLLARAVREAAA